MNEIYLLLYVPYTSITKFISIINILAKYIAGIIYLL